MVGVSIVKSVYEGDVKDNVVWFPTLTIIVLIWLFVPFISMLLSALFYELIKRVVLIKNAKIRSLIITPYISGIVFISYFAFIFATQYFTKIPSKTKTYSFQLY